MDGNALSAYQGYLLSRMIVTGVYTNTSTYSNESAIATLTIPLGVTPLKVLIFVPSISDGYSSSSNKSAQFYVYDVANASKSVGVYDYLYVPFQDDDGWFRGRNKATLSLSGTNLILTVTTYKKNMQADISKLQWVAIS